ncbi:MAG: hypothetical protein ACYC5Q_03880 [Thermoleophilia bacterium]
MSGTDRFVAGLRDEAVPACDDCITLAVGWSRRQSTNAAGRALAASGVIHRAKGTCARCGRVKTVSRLGDTPPALATKPSLPSWTTGTGLGRDRPWHWEGNLQAALAGHLVAQGYRLRQAVDTALKQRGVDVVAERDGETLWVTVKGYPEGTPKTNAATQSRHWFAHAMFDVARYRTDRADVAIGVALPDGIKTYLDLASKVAWLKETAPFRFFWVAEDGAVREE